MSKISNISLVETPEGEFVVAVEESGDKPKNGASFPSTHTNFALLRELYSDDVALFDPQLGLAENLANTIKACVKLPVESQLDIVLGYLLTPSAVIPKVGVLTCLGQAGSGKSVLGVIAAQLYDVQVLAGTSTYAAIRNALNKNRWYDPDSMVYERNTMLVFDDLKRAKMADPDIFTFFRCGYDRQSERIEISSKESGINLIFRSFSPKIFSTTSPFIFEGEWEELNRRAIVINHARCNDEEIEFIDPSDIDFKPLRKQYQSVYDNEGVEAYLKHFKSIKRPRSITSTRWQISRSIVATLSFLEVLSVEGAKALVANYWETFEPPKSTLHQLIELQIESAKKTRNDNMKLKPLQEWLDPAEVDPEVLKAVVSKADRSGVLEEPATPTRVQDILAKCGFELAINPNGDTVWREVMSNE